MIMVFAVRKGNVTESVASEIHRGDLGFETLLLGQRIVPEGRLSEVEFRSARTDGLLPN